MLHFARLSLGRRFIGRQGLDRLLFVMLLAAWGIGCLGWSLIALPLRRILPSRISDQVGQSGVRTGFRILIGLMQASGLCRFDLSALDRLDSDKALVIAANHPGLLDAVLVTARLPRVVCISKASLWNNLFLGGGIRLAGYPRHDSALALVRGGIASLGRGRHLLVFPEGTRTMPGMAVQPFHGGFAVMAKAAGVPVQTILIEAAGPYLRKDWPLLRMPPLPIVISVRLGRRFTVEGDVKRFVSGLESYFRSELAPGAPWQVAEPRHEAVRLHQPA